MLQRACVELMSMKNVVVINDEAHHCYDERTQDSVEELDGADTKAEAKENKEAARLWINGIKALKKKVGVRAVYDLSATPFFLAGSGYVEGTLFPWVVSDFSLMDAIECGIVKLPRVPVADNLPIADMPIYRKLWDHIGKVMPKKGAKKAEELDPLKLPTQLLTALDALYNHYVQVHEEWRRAGIPVPPVFIVVCNNTSTSKLIYEYISGWDRPNPDGELVNVHRGHLELFRNYDEHGNRIARAPTLLIDSAQLESGEALDADFRKMAAAEIEQFRRERQDRTGRVEAADDIDDAELLREVMNTVGRVGRLGESIRCVVSVSMLTEGWDANTVTHILGVRAFGTQLLCEQVVGRGLRRQSYELNEQGLFDVEYADVLGIPFDFTAKPVIVKPVIAAPDVQQAAIERAISDLGYADLPPRFVVGEWRNVVDAWNLPDLESYASVPRIGRRNRLGSKQRENMWPVFEAARAALASRGLLTLSQLFAAVERAFASAERPPFSHVIVDEAQDLGVAELRMMAALASGPNALFFAGDLGQRIFQLPFSWLNLGIDVRGRSSSLRINYRTSRQIREAADLLLPQKVRDVDGIEDDRTGAQSIFEGPAPTVAECTDETDEIEQVSNLLRAAIEEGISAGEIGIFVRSSEYLSRSRAAVTAAGLDGRQLTERADEFGDCVSIGTMHFAKGLEFKMVVVMACDDEALPLQARVDEATDEDELKEVFETERHLFYVACTRARDRLHISGVRPVSDFVADMRSQS